jgi:hypothetical protein
MKITQLHPPVPVQSGSAREHDQSMVIYRDSYLHGTKISPAELEKFGYRLTARHLSVGSGYKLFELLPINGSHDASQSFLAPNHRLPGVIVPRTFNEHKSAVNPLTALARSGRRIRL